MYPGLIICFPRFWFFIRLLFWLLFWFVLRRYCPLYGMGIIRSAIDCRPGVRLHVIYGRRCWQCCSLNRVCIGGLVLIKMVYACVIQVPVSSRVLLNIRLIQILIGWPGGICRLRIVIRLTIGGGLYRRPWIIPRHLRIII